MLQNLPHAHIAATSDEVFLSSIQPTSLSLSFFHVHEWEMLEMERKITNFTNHSMHCYTSAISQFLFIFRCHWRPSWQMHKVNTYLLFQKHWGMVQWWEQFNSCLGYPRQRSHTQTLWARISELSSTLHFYSDLSRRVFARVSRTCCFRLPEQMGIISAFYFSSQKKKDLPFLFPVFLPLWYIPTL